MLHMTKKYHSCCSHEMNANKKQIVKNKNIFFFMLMKKAENNDI